jgi:hypothetical protein
MFNASYFIEQWNEKNNSNLKVSDFIKEKDTLRFMNILAVKENLNHVGECFNDGIIAVNNTVTNDEGIIHTEIWFHRYLFSDFLIYVNEELKYEALKFITDNLIDMRNTVGSKYREWVNLLTTIGANQTDIKTIQCNINIIVFGKHEKDIRNSATFEELTKILEIQSTLSSLIKLNIATTPMEVLSHLVNLFRK